MYRLLGLPMTQFSRKIKYLSTSDCQKRDGLLKPNLEDIEDGESIFFKTKCARTLQYIEDLFHLASYLLFISGLLSAMIL